MKSLYVLFIPVILNTAYCEVQLLENDVQSGNSDSDSGQSESSKTGTNNDLKSENNGTAKNVQVTQLNHGSNQPTTQKQVPNTQNIKPKPIKKVHAILELTKGNIIYNNDKNRIDIYVAPTCLHCGKFLIEDLLKFLDNNSNKCFVRIRLLPVSAKDLFVMKLIQSEARDINSYYAIYINYVKRAYATFNNINPTDLQKSLYIGSNTDSEMIKYQVIASEFGFSDEKIIRAYPEMSADYELAVMDWYKDVVAGIKHLCPNKELDLPLIVQNGKKYNSINDVPLN